MRRTPSRGPSVASALILSVWPLKAANTASIRAILAASAVSSVVSKTQEQRYGCRATAPPRAHRALRSSMVTSITNFARPVRDRPVLERVGALNSGEPSSASSSATVDFVVPRSTI